LWRGGNHELSFTLNCGEEDTSIWSDSIPDLDPVPDDGFL
jgi:hypothetical protein